jgi:undecaprenyl phosphate N,N'-diacetylbacillosamine 1-phosphate transferase
MKSFYTTIGKRMLDVLISLPLLILSLPVMLLISILLLITGHARVFFVQKRAGFKDKPFNLIKFRTMTDERDKQGVLLPDAKRLTAVGAFIRKTSMDELPQLINVLQGKMSLIGPRPLLVEYLPLYNDEQRKRHMVRPGITGWAQVNGRNEISWEKKFEYDVWYVNNLSFAIDCKIALRTIRNIIRADNISQEGHATVETFKGNNK